MKQYICKWNNTYSHLHEITCKHVYEIGKDTKIQFFFERTQRFPRNIEKIKEGLNFELQKKCPSLQ
jgi:hypothetical protein